MIVWISHWFYCWIFVCEMNHHLSNCWVLLIFNTWYWNFTSSQKEKYVMRSEWMDVAYIVYIYIYIYSRIDLTRCYDFTLLWANFDRLFETIAWCHVFDANINLEHVVYLYTKHIQLNVMLTNENRIIRRKLPKWLNVCNVPEINFIINVKWWMPQVFVTIKMYFICINWTQFCFQAIWFTRATIYVVHFIRFLKYFISIRIDCFIYCLVGVCICIYNIFQCTLTEIFSMLMRITKWLHVNMVKNRCNFVIQKLKFHVVNSLSPNITRNVMFCVV